MRLKPDAAHTETVAALATSAPSKSDFESTLQASFKKKTEEKTDNALISFTSFSSEAPSRFIDAISRLIEATQ